MTTSALAFVVAPPAFLRYSLRALLTRLPQIAEVHEADDVRSLLLALSDARPQLIVLDGDLLPDDVAHTLDQIKAMAPQARLVVLVDRIEQQRAVEATVADRVLLKGYLAADLFANVEQLLDQSDRADHQS